MLLRYVADIVQAFKGEPTQFFDAANSLNPNLQFTLDKMHTDPKLPLLDLNIVVSRDKKVNWNQKPSDTRTTLNYRSCANSVKKTSAIEAPYIEFLGVHLFERKLIKLIGRKGWQTISLIFSKKKWQQTSCAKSLRIRARLWTTLFFNSITKKCETTGSK